MTTSFVITDDADSEFDPEFLESEDPAPAADETLEYDTPSDKIGGKKRRSTKAISYERKIQNVFSSAFRVLVAHPTTVSDGAAVMMHGPDIAEKAGDLAAHDKRIARAIDMLTEGTENPYLNLLAASAPLVIQVMRNHENAKPSAVLREFRIPFTKKTFKLRLRFRLPKMPPPVRNLSNDPEALNRHVFTDDKVSAMLKREGINVAWRDR